MGGSDLAGLNRLAQQLDGARGLARLAQVVDRWVYSACLCFALSREQQQRSGFHYAYSCYQLEYSRNLVFKSGRQLDAVYQGLIDARADCWTCPDSKPSSVANGVPENPSTRRAIGENHRPLSV